MPRRPNVKEKIPLTTSRASRLVGNLKDAVVSVRADEETPSITLTEAQERRLLDELRLRSASAERAALKAIYPILYMFQRERQLSSMSGREEHDRAVRAANALERAIKTLRDLGPRGAQAVEDPYSEADSLDDLIVLLSEAEISLGIFARDLKLKRGVRPNTDIENAMRNLVEVYERYRGRAPGVGGPFERFCAAVLTPLDQRVTPELVRTYARNITARRPKV